MSLVYIVYFVLYVTPKYWFSVSIYLTYLNIKDKPLCFSFYEVKPKKFAYPENNHHMLKYKTHLTLIVFMKVHYNANCNEYMWVYN